MDRYIEYPIRCFKCGGVIDGLAMDYEDLVLSKGYSREEAFEELGIPAKDYCCRESLINPTTVFFNMEIDVVVTGKANLENAHKTEPDDYVSKFGTCLNGVMGTKAKYPVFEDQTIKVERLFDEEEEVILLEEATQLIPTVPGIPTINPSSTNTTKVHVGAGKNTVKLNGRTYIAT